MQEIVTFLKSLLSRKLLLAVAAFYANHRASIPPKWQSIADMVIAGFYFAANVYEKKVTNGTSVVVNNAPPEVPSTFDPEQPLQDVPPAP